MKMQRTEMEYFRGKIAANHILNPLGMSEKNKLQNKSIANLRRHWDHAFAVCIHTPSLHNSDDNDEIEKSHTHLLLMVDV